MLSRFRNSAQDDKQDATEFEATRLKEIRRTKEEDESKENKKSEAGSERKDAFQKAKVSRTRVAHRKKKRSTREEPAARKAEDCWNFAANLSLLSKGKDRERPGWG